MPTSRNCPVCRTPLAEGSPNQLCPKCLLRLGLQTAAGPVPLHIRCPHCQNPVEIVEDAELAEITCPVCDSQFSLLDDVTVPYDSTQPKRIGRFELLQRAGVGGFGSVWRARDTELDRTVAVKVPRSGQLSPEETEQFLREARAAAQLRHANIVSVYEVGRADGHVYIVSDFVDGVTLADHLSAHRFSNQESARLAAVIADALVHAHHQGVIHRDLKPSNILLERASSNSLATYDSTDHQRQHKTDTLADSLIPHITDFGLARRESGEITVTLDGRILGTPAYMSPEQARGEGHRADARSDIYSLGVILFEMLTGEKPFRGTSRMLLDQVLHDEPPSPKKFNAAVDRDLETICLKCLEKDPARRYATAEKLAADLKRYLNGEPIAARPISRAQRCWRWCRRRPLQAAVVAIGSLAAMALVGVAVMLFYNARLQQLADKARRQRDVAIFAEKLAERQKETAQQLRIRAEGLAGDVQRYWYAADVSTAFHAWRSGEIDRMRSALQRHKEATNAEDVRGFEWHYLSSLAGSEIYRLRDDSGVLTSVAFSPDGNVLATGGRGVVKLRDAATGNAQRELSGGEGYIYSVTFSPDGQLLAGCSMVNSDEPGEVLIWEMATGDVVQHLQGHSTGIYHATFDPQGLTIATAGFDNDCKIWNVESGQLVHTFEVDGGSGDGDSVLSLAYTPDGATLITGGYDAAVRMWDLASGEQRDVVRLENSQEVYEVVVSPDGSLIAAGMANEVVILSIADQSPLGTLRFHGNPQRLAFTPDSTTLAVAIATTGGRGEVQVWDVATRTVRVRLHGEIEMLVDAALSPDAKRIAAVGRAGPTYESAAITGYPVEWQERQGAIAVWDSTTWETTSVLTGHTDFVAITPDGQTLVSTGMPNTNMMADALDDIASDNTTVALWNLVRNGIDVFQQGTSLQFWNTPTAQLVESVPMGDTRILSGMALSPDGDMAVIAEQDGEIQTWDVPTRKPFGTFSVQDSSGETISEVTSLAISSDGELLAVGGAFLKVDGFLQALRIGVDRNSGDVPGSVQLWHLKLQQPLARLEGHREIVAVVAFSPNGKRLATASATRQFQAGRGEIKVWDVTTREELFSLDAAGGVHSVAFSPSGTVLAAAVNSAESVGVVKLFSATSGEHLRTLEGHFAAVDSLAFSHDGKTLATGGPAQVRLWQVATGQELMSMEVGLTGVTSLAFTPDDRTLVAGQSFGPIVVWRAKAR